jgi:lactonase
VKRRRALAIIVQLTLAMESTASTLALRRDPRMTGPVPVPSAERELPTAVAEKWFRVTEQNSPLEGAAFDHDGNLVFCDVGASRVLRLTADKKLSVLLDEPGLHAGGLAVHADGRIFAAGTGDSQRGALGIIDTTDHTFHEVARTSTPYVPNDLVFDRHGGFYFTDFKGTALDPLGGVYYVAPDMRTVTSIAKNLALANGIALSPDGKTLWVTEFGQNRLLCIRLKNPTTVADLGVAVAYYFIGPAPDSMRVDAEGNVYVALTGQGRVLIFSPGGIPIGQILLPDRETGHNLKSASLALKPGTNEVYIVASDGVGGQGGAVFRATTFVTAPPSPNPDKHTS